MKFKTFLLGALTLPIGACGTLNLRREAAPAAIEPLVISPACLVPPLEPQPVEEPPMPEPIERPAGQPTATNWTQWFAYIDRRRVRAELAGRYFQGERDAIEHAYALNAETQTQCRNWAREQGQ